MTPLMVGLAIVGLAWGLIADRIAARWPSHEDGSIRAVDWRTAAVALVGAAALGQIGQRFPDPASSLLYGLVFVVLILLLATDLDQRTLPDELTLPLAAFAAVYGL